MLGNNVKFVTGTDEHGKKIEQSAINAGIKPLEFVNNVSQLFRDLLPTINIANDDFIRTTQERHKKAVSHLWNTLYDNGYIYLGEYSGWYDVRNEAYFSEDELINGKSPHGCEVVRMNEECYFFKLSEFQDRLLDFYEQHPNFIYPTQRRNEVVSFVRGGLRDLAISRKTFKWGIPVPNDNDHVIYVWLDALTNYLTLNNYPENLDQNNDEFWKNAIHFVGKEIVRFHAVYWPAFLMAAGISPPKQIVVHGWWLSEGEKMSKSLGNVQDPVKYCNLFGSDSLRYFLLRELAFGSDGNFSLEGFIGRYNGILANSYGNLCKRTISFVQKYCNCVVNKPEKFTEEDIKLNEKIDGLLGETVGLVNGYSLNKYLEKIEQALSLANQFIDHQKPWELKDKDEKKTQDVLYILLDNIYKITSFFGPVIPQAAAKVMAQINVSEEGVIRVDDRDEQLFPKIDTKNIGDFDVFAKD
jgi:methionyl-tRNA synthetase